jgi:hypothetical protein
MLRHVVKASACAALLLAAGCVELKQTITLNADGKGKVAYDILMPADISFEGAGLGDGKEKTLDQKKQDMLVKTLTGMDHKGIVAWRDVSLDWTADGRLHFTGTAYFEKLEELGGKDDPDIFQMTREKDTLKITVKPRGNMEANKKPLPDLAKMTDKDLDEFILKERVKYQSSKPMLTAMLTDLKFTTILHLPGDVGEVKAFKKDGARAVSREFDGNTILAKYKAFMAQDNAALNKKIKMANTLDFDKLFSSDIDVLHDGSVIVPKVGEAQFDFDNEVKEARAAYPKLRKQLNLPDTAKLPGE